MSAQSPGTAPAAWADDLIAQFDAVKVRADHMAIVDVNLHRIHELKKNAARLDTAMMGSWASTNVPEPLVPLPELMGSNAADRDEAKAYLLEWIDRQKERTELHIKDLRTLQHGVGAYTAANGLEHQFRDTALELADDKLYEDGREIDTSPNGVASRMLIDAYAVSAKLDELLAGLGG